MSTHRTIQHTRYTRAPFVVFAYTLWPCFGRVQCEKKKWCARVTHVLNFNYWLLTCLSNWRRATKKPPTRIVCVPCLRNADKNKNQREENKKKVEQIAAQLSVVLLELVKVIPANEPLTCQ